MATKVPTENKVPLPTKHWIGVIGVGDGVRIRRSSQHCPQCGSGNTYRDYGALPVGPTDEYGVQEIEYWIVPVRCDSCGATWDEILTVAFITNIPW